MNTLNLASDDEPVVKKKSNTRNLKIVLGLAAVILIPTIGSTLAGNIAVSSDAVEFGQGVVATTGCDTVITVTPSTTLTSGIFYLTGIAISDVWNTTAAGCADKYFTLKVVDSSGNLVNITNGLGEGGSVTQIKFQLPTPCVASTGVTEVTNATVTTGVCSIHTGGSGSVTGADTGTIAITIATSVLASSVDKITLESSTT